MHYINSTDRSLGKSNLSAVVVGIDGYKSIPPLNCAVNDAVSISETLRKVWPHYDVRCLVWPRMEGFREREIGWGITLPKNAEGVTRESILNSVRKAAADCGEDDTFVFYYAGHGELTGDEPTLIVIGDGTTGEGRADIKIRDIQQAASSAVCKTKVMILDCCQDQANTAVKSMKYDYLKNISDEWWILLSCSPGERSWEDQSHGEASDDYLQQGIFTASLVAGLRGEASSEGEPVTLTQLAAYAGNRVPMEFQEKLMQWISGIGERSLHKSPAPTSQNPVLMGGVFAVGGTYQVTMAPNPVPHCQDSKKSWPGKSFLIYWFKFLFGKWPIRFPHKHAFREGGALLYGVVMLFTVIWHSLQPPGASSDPLYWTVTGLGSALLWWTAISFAVAVNEERWFNGGYLILLFYLFWHGALILWYWFLFDGVAHPGGGDCIYYLVNDLVLLLIAVWICCCNASHTIIALAEPMRDEIERRETRMVIRAFQQFRTKSFNVSLFSYIPLLSANPRMYFLVFLIIFTFLGINTYNVVSIYSAVGEILWVFIPRNVLIAIFFGWLTVWYGAAFRFLEKEIYKR